jgi:hypothetical protein
VLISAILGELVDGFLTAYLDSSMFAYFNVHDGGIVVTLGTKVLSE